MDRIAVRLKESESLYGEKLEILKEGLCKSVFPVSVLRAESTAIGYYNVDGYRKIGDYNELTAKSLLMALEKIFLAFEECTQYLIFPEEFVVNVNTIYIDERFTHVKFIYIPQNKCNYKSTMRILLTELSKITTEEGRLYLGLLWEIIEKENLSYLKMKYIISKFLGEISKNQTI